MTLSNEQLIEKLNELADFKPGVDSCKDFWDNDYYGQNKKVTNEASSHRLTNNS